MDNYHECLVSRASTGGDAAKKIGMTLLALVLSALCVVFFMSLFPINIFAVAGIFYGCFYLCGNLGIEYEYIITNDEMDVDKITGKRKRKRLITAPIRKFEDFGRLDDAPELPDSYTTVLASDGTGTADYYCDFNHERFGNVRIIFTPDEETVNAIMQNLPQLLKAKMRQKNILSKSNNK